MTQDCCAHAPALRLYLDELLRALREEACLQFNSPPHVEYALSIQCPTCRDHLTWVLCGELLASASNEAALVDVEQYGVSPVTVVRKYAETGVWLAPRTEACIFLSAIVAALLKLMEAAPPAPGALLEEAPEASEAADICSANSSAALADLAHVRSAAEGYESSAAEDYESMSRALWPSGEPDQLEAYGFSVGEETPSPHRSGVCEMDFSMGEEEEKKSREREDFVASRMRDIIGGWGVHAACESPLTEDGIFAGI